MEDRLIGRLIGHQIGRFRLTKLLGVGAMGEVYRASDSRLGREVDGTTDRQLTVGDASHVQPDVHRSGRLVASRIRCQSDIWRFAVNGDPVANTQAAVRITHQTGQVQTPSISPDGRQMVYLSDHGGHGNLWIAAFDGSTARQITF